MKNTLADLNNYLFESIERLNDDGLTNEELEKEIKRSTLRTIHLAAARILRRKK